MVPLIIFSSKMPNAKITLILIIVLVINRLDLTNTFVLFRGRRSRSESDSPPYLRQPVSLPPISRPKTNRNNSIFYLYIKHKTTSPPPLPQKKNQSEGYPPAKLELSKKSRDEQQYASRFAALGINDHRCLTITAMTLTGEQNRYLLPPEL